MRSKATTLIGILLVYSIAATILLGVQITKNVRMGTDLIDMRKTVSRAGRSLRKCERITNQYHKINLTWGQVCLRSKEKKKIKAASSAIRKNAAASTRGKHDHRD